MFDIRSMQEPVIYEAVKTERGAETAREVAYGKGLPEQHAESDPAWAQSAMRRLENRFQAKTREKIRRNCPCGRRMEERLALVKAPRSSAANIEKFAKSEGQGPQGFFAEMAHFIRNLMLVPAYAGGSGTTKDRYLAPVYNRMQQSPF